MIIYRATNNVTNKSYVGLTSKTLKERKARHLVSVRGGSTVQFHNALRKYDESCWKWEILEKCETRVDANLLEMKHIEENNTFNGGYNGTRGGEDLVFKSNISLEDLDLIKLTPINVGRSYDYKKAISNNKKAFFQTEEGKVARQKQSEKMKEFWASPEGQKQKEVLSKKCGRKQVKAVNKEGRTKIIEQYENGTTVSQLSRDYGVSRTTIKRYIESD